MEKIADNKYPLVRQEGDKKIILPGYPTYPASDDIYNQAKEEKEINPEEILKLKEDSVDDSLDIPEPDTVQPEIDSKDEENNYYNLGSDNNDNL